MAKDSDTLADAKEQFDRCRDAEEENREAALDDLRFARLGEQWDERDKATRERQRRPCLTINRMPSFIRQVVNDARQNKPQIKVKPVDDYADPMTAKIMDGLIRNIEYTSNAEVAYDTAAEFAVTGGFGYIRVNIDYACDDTFDKDLKIERVANPFSIYGDPNSTAADSSDWNVAFATDLMTKDAFKAKYKGAEPVNWEDLVYERMNVPWREGEQILIAEYWMREEVPRTILLLSNGMIVSEKELKLRKDEFDASALTVVTSRETKGYKVTQRIMTGAEILETNEWAGRYIPIIPVYGEEVNIEGKRYFRSMIRDAKDAQRMFNYWRTCSTELVALAPKAPWVGPKGAFETDLRKWETANTEPHSFLEYDIVSGPPPQRQPFAGVPAGALQEALNASDDMKSIMGLYDASLGARSNETSGIAIQTRQREGDVSTFHFIDNLSRGIKHTGRVLLDLIPLVYNKERIIRVLGSQGEVATVRIGPTPPQMAQGVPQGMPAPMMQGQPQQAPAPGQEPPPFDVNRVYDLTAGKYDLAVETGPSFTTQRQEFVAQMVEIIRAFPAGAPVLADLILKHMDFPGAQEAAQRLAQASQAAQGGKGVDPAMVAKLEQTVALLKTQLAGVKADKSIDAQEAQIHAFEAQTERIRTAHEILRPQPVPAPQAPR
jgi:hypothetical protein